ncbi:SseB family protein [Pendulispora brunnea]|uniref:SseB family protein n=1 Tax=Pendulispora brunnea TaxID=2905690 RepID=A0ABZ2K319_9BACT
MAYPLLLYANVDTLPSPDNAKCTTALRIALARVQGAFHQEAADAFYELLLRTPLYLPFDNGVMTVPGPQSEAAVPIFIDEAAMVRWAGQRVPHIVCSAREAAVLALVIHDAWLVLNMGSSPGGQPIAREGVMLLAHGSYPGAERYEEAAAFVHEAAAAAGQPTLDLLERAKRTRIVSIGRALRYPGGTSAYAFWPSFGGAMLFDPNERVAQMSFESLIVKAFYERRGLVLAPDREALRIGPAHVAKWHTAMQATYPMRA